MAVQSLHQKQPDQQQRNRDPRYLATVALLGALLAGQSPAEAQATAPEAADATSYVQFPEDFAATCVSRNGVQIQVKSTHPTRTLRVYLDRFYRGVWTGDRSRSELAPGTEPQPLGCSITLDGGKQEWRLVRATFID